jgi:hypothetical protein
MTLRKPPPATSHASSAVPSSRSTRASAATRPRPPAGPFCFVSGTARRGSLGATQWRQARTVAARPWADTGVALETRNLEGKPGRGEGRGRSGLARTRHKRVAVSGGGAKAFAHVPQHALQKASAVWAGIFWLWPCRLSAWGPHSFSFSCGGLLRAADLTRAGKSSTSTAGSCCSRHETTWAYGGRQGTRAKRKLETVQRACLLLSKAGCLLGDSFRNTGSPWPPTAAASNAPEAPGPAAYRR